MKARVPALIPVVGIRSSVEKCFSCIHGAGRRCQMQRRPLVSGLQSQNGVRRRQAVFSTRPRSRPLGVLQQRRKESRVVALRRDVEDGSPLRWFSRIPRHLWKVTFRAHVQGS
eukprot:scaffold1070_cov245-Pinguiococcus_pyrenoidosus.AAC.46